MLWIIIILLIVFCTLPSCASARQGIYALKGTLGNSESLTNIPITTTPITTTPITPTTTTPITTPITTTPTTTVPPVIYGVANAFTGLHCYDDSLPIVSNDSNTFYCISPDNVNCLQRNSLNIPNSFQIDPNYAIQANHSPFIKNQIYCKPEDIPKTTDNTSFSVTSLFPLNLIVNTATNDANGCLMITLGDVNSTILGPYNIGNYATTITTNDGLGNFTVIMNDTTTQKVNITLASNTSGILTLTNTINNTKSTQDILLPVLPLTSFSTLSYVTITNGNILLTLKNGTSLGPFVLSKKAVSASSSGPNFIITTSDGITSTINITPNSNLN